MIESIFAGMLTNLLYDILKSTVTPSVHELQNLTNYSQAECEKLETLAQEIKESSKLTKNDIYDTLCNNASLVQEIRANNFKTNFSIRLDYILGEIKKCIKEANVEWLSSELNYASANELLKYYQIQTEPTFEFIQDFANKAGIKYEWMAYGSDYSAFETVHISLDQNLARYICQKNVKSIYFLFTQTSLSKHANSEITMIFKFNHLKYVTNTLHIPFGDYVGGGGARMICDLYMFLRWLNKKYTSCQYYSISVPNDVKESLVMGETYGGIVTQYEVCNSNGIIEDFLYDRCPDNCEPTVAECRAIIKANKELIKNNLEYWMEC